MKIVAMVKKGLTDLISDRKILRQQMALLAEYSKRGMITDRAANGHAIAEIYRCLYKGIYVEVFGIVFFDFLIYTLVFIKKFRR